MQRLMETKWLWTTPSQKGKEDEEADEEVLEGAEEDEEDLEGEEEEGAGLEEAEEEVDTVEEEEEGSGVINICHTTTIKSFHFMFVHF